MSISNNVGIKETGRPMYLVALSLVMVVIMAFAVISITPPATSDNKDATDLDQDMGTCGDGLIWDYS